MRAVLTVRLALPCNCVCRLSSGLAMEEQEEIPDTLASVIGAVFQVQPLPLEFIGHPCHGTSSHGWVLTGFGIVKSDCRSVFPSRWSSRSPSLTGTLSFVPFLSPGGHWCEQAYCRNAQATSVPCSFCCKDAHEREHRVNALLTAVLTR